MFTDIFLKLGYKKRKHNNAIQHIKNFNINKKLSNNFVDINLFAGVNFLSPQPKAIFMNYIKIQDDIINNTNSNIQDLTNWQMFILNL